MLVGVQSPLYCGEPLVRTRHALLLAKLTGGGQTPRVLSGPPSEDVRIPLHMNLQAV